MNALKQEQFDKIISTNTQDIKVNAKKIIEHSKFPFLQAPKSLIWLTESLDKQGLVKKDSSVENTSIDEQIMGAWLICFDISERKYFVLQLWSAQNGAQSLNFWLFKFSTQGMNNYFDFQLWNSES